MAIMQVDCCYTIFLTLAPAANAADLMRRISPASSFVNAKHLWPRSFSDAQV